MWTGTILPFFQSDGNIPFARQSLNMSSKDLHINFPHIFNTRMLILSWPRVLFELRFWIIFNMSVFTNFTVDKHFSVRKWSRGEFTVTLIKEHCFAKKEHCVKSVQIRSFLWSVFSGWYVELKHDYFHFTYVLWYIVLLIIVTILAYWQILI